ncbi:MAG: hypothetical protein ACREI8_02485 [Myxococcota bacterium]
MNRQAALPFAGRTVISLEPAHFEVLKRTVATVFRLAHTTGWQGLVDEGAPASLRFAPGNFGVFMGYDFHVTPSGPRLIEINTNAGGALVNGLHTAALCDPVKLACLCADLMPVETVEERLVQQFVMEYEAARGPGARPRTLVIADEKPREQFLHPEFELLRSLFERGGFEAHICDTGEIVRRADGRLVLADRPVDLVYLRDTDFTLEAPRNAALRAAYLDGAVVVTPAPREYFLLADKRRLAILSSREALAKLGVADDDAAFLASVVPETRLLAELNAESVWRGRRDWVFKPATAFGSRAVYRGDKISRRRFEEVRREPGYLAQRRVEPGEVRVETSDGPLPMKFDVRAYAYRDEILLLGARVYQGQVTNLRSPGGGFSAICVARSAGEQPC